MKPKIYLIIISFIWMMNVTIAQSLKMSELEGIWKYTPGNVSVNTDEDFEAYAIQGNHKRLFITFWKNPKTITSNLEYWGLFEGENPNFTKVSDLKNIGNNFFSIDQKCVNQQTKVFNCAGRSTKIEYEIVNSIENEATKFYLHWHQKPDDYKKTETLPKELIERIKEDKNLWQQFLSFEKAKASFKTIKIAKAIIYNSQKKATKMYFVKGDKIEALEENLDWIKFRFVNKRAIVGWVKTMDVE